LFLLLFLSSSLLYLLLSLSFYFCFFSPTVFSLTWLFSFSSSILPPIYFSPSFAINFLFCPPLNFIIIIIIIIPSSHSLLIISLIHYYLFFLTSFSILLIVTQMKATSGSWFFLINPLKTH
jgi:hypothetical protein